ncbi:MAG: hypothetical protein LBE35_05175 [Clostridiales bacterium]|nr:hypothetical protein [Clostridiales bacterium]
MRKNVFLKSQIRQLLRGLVLFLLIGAAAFGFVLRTVEYLVVSEQVHEIARHFRSIGFLRPSEAEELPAHLHRDVAAAAEIIAQSPLVDFEDRRYAVEGLLVGMNNAHIYPGGHRPDGVRPYFAFVYGELGNVLIEEEASRKKPWQTLGFFKRL